MDNKEKMFQTLKTVAETCDTFVACTDCPLCNICCFWDFEEPRWWIFNEKDKTIFEQYRN